MKPYGALCLYQQWFRHISDCCLTKGSHYRYMNKSWIVIRQTGTWFCLNEVLFWTQICNARKRICKCCVPNGGHFVQCSVSWMHICLVYYTLEYYRDDSAHGMWYDRTGKLCPIGLYFTCWLDCGTSHDTTVMRWYNEPWNCGGQRECNKWPGLFASQTNVQIVGIPRAYVILCHSYSKTRVKYDKFHDSHMTDLQKAVSTPTDMLRWYISVITPVEWKD